MPQKPVGTRVLPSAEWFAGNTAMAGALYRAAAGNGAQLSLFNDAPAGQYLWVWWFNVFNDGDGTFLFSSFEGQQGSFLQQGAWITVGRGTTFGQVLGEDLVGEGNDFPPPGTQIGSLGAGGDEAAADSIFRTPGPFVVIPPGFSFAVSNNFFSSPISAATFCVTFYYSVLPYIPDKSP
jgi:hypothetical protein